MPSRGIAGEWSLTEFRKILPHTIFHFKSRTYLALILFGFGLTVVGAAILPLMTFSWRHVAWFAAGFAVSFFVFFDVFYQFVVRPKATLRPLLAFIVLGVWCVAIAGPVWYTPLGDWAADGTMMGWMMSWSFLGTEFYFYKREAERAGKPGATLGAINPAKRGKPEMRARFIVSASLFIALAVGVMIWMLIDLAIDPSYEFNETWYEWAAWVLWILLYVAAFVVLYLAFRKKQARLFMLAATMSAFSWTGFACVVSELMIWWAYKRYDLPWGNEDTSGTVWLSDDEETASRTAAGIGAALIGGVAALWGLAFPNVLNWLVLLVISILVEAVLIILVSGRSGRRKEGRLG